MTIQMKALKSFPYAGRRVRVGEVFNARGRSDARVLEAIGNAKTHTEAVKIVPPAMFMAASAHATVTVTPVVEIKAEFAAGVVDDLAQVREAVTADEPQNAEEGSAENVGVAEEEPATTEQEKPRQKRAYRRRDMAAQDD